MAKLGIFTGTSPNDTSGDTLSQGAVKINSNFSEIYNAIGDGTNITNSLSSITVSGISTFTNGPVLVGSGIQTGTSKLQVSGNTFITGSVGIGTTNPTSKLDVQGNVRITGVATVGFLTATNAYAGVATVGFLTATNIWVSGVTTFTNGPVLIGGGTSTGTVGQVLQVTGISSGVYIGGSVGIGTTTPIESLHVVGNLKVTGTITGEVSSTVATARTSTNVIGGIASVTQLQVGPGITTVGFITATSAYAGVATVGFLTATSAYAGVATVGFLTATSAYAGVATVGFLTATNIWVSGVSTFVGNSYFSNSIGVGITNPTSSLSVNGSTVIGTQILNMTGLSSTFTTVGSNTFIVPAGVTKISAVLIGGGGAGGGSDGSSGGNGGGGGGLRYVNDFPVTPGQTLDVFVGGGGVGSGGVGGNGGNSSITGIATAFGGTGGASDYQQAVGAGGVGSGGSGGGTGGSGGKATLTTGAGGGGAAGYSGNGGTGGDATFGGLAGSGGGAGGGAAPTASGSGGGGVEVFGQGSSGLLTNGAGNAGSGGLDGSLGNTINGASGGLYGGGGGGCDGGSGGASGGNGAQGIVRIIWSPRSKFSRLFPTTQVGNNINQ
jgi:hypothetical protein